MKTIRLVLLLASVASLGAPQEATPAGTDRQDAAVVSTLPMMLDYGYFSHYLSQTISDDDRYSRIEAYIGGGDMEGPTRVVLTSKAPGKSVCYVSGRGARDALEPDAGPVIETPIQVTIPEALTQNTPIEIALRDQTGQPLRWRFVCAYGSSPQGSGLAPLPGIGGLTLQYRNLGTVAGSGSVVELGNRLSYAEMWREISSPPYFVPYRGYYGEGFHVARLLLQDRKWQAPEAPQNLAAGSHWELVGAGGARQAFTVSQTGELKAVSTAIEARRETLTALLESSSGPVRIRSLEAAQCSHRMVVAFHPALVLAAASSVEFQVEADKKKLAQGTVEVAKIDGGYELSWRFKSPDWAKTRVLHQAVRASAEGVALRVTQ